MRVFASVLLVVCSALAIEVTYPGDSNGWTTTGPNTLLWQHVSTDPSNFSVFLTNVNSGYSQLLDAFINGTLDETVCSTPSGGWPSGSGFRVNIATDPLHPGSLLAQSNEFSITAVSSTVTGPSQTSSAPSVSSSNTSTTPTGTSAASLSAVAQAGVLAIVAALTALATLF